MSLGNTNIHQQGEIPEITKLPNGRIRVVRRFVKFTREDVDNTQLGTLLGDFGDLDTDGEQIVNQGYTNCRLIEVEVERVTKRSAGTDSKDNVLVQTYETLTGSFVETTDPTISIAENGLRQITKVYRAISGTVSSGVIGVTQLASGEFLASSQIEDNTAFAELTEIYLEAGILSETLDSVGSQKAKVIETIGIDPVTPDGYLLANKKESDFEGFQTNQFTFLKPSILSRNIDTRNQGNLKIETVESFNLDPTSTINGVLISEKVSDVEGIPTNQNVYAEGSGEVSRTIETRNNGALTITTVEALGSAGTAIGLEIEATTREEDGYTLFRNVFADGQGEVSRTVETRNQGKLTITTVEALGEAGIETGVEIEATTREQDGYTLFRNTFADGSGEVSRTTESRNQGKLTITTVEALGSAGSANGVEIEATTREQDGYTLFRNTFADGQGEVSRTTETRNQGKLTITTVEALGSAGSAGGVEIEATTREQDGYTLFRNVFADGEGEVSRTVEKRNKGKLTITTVEALGSAGSAIGVEIESTTREQDGYTLFRNVFADGQGEVSRTVEKRIENVLTITTVESLGEAGNADGIEIEETTREQDGYTLFRNIFADGEGEISRSEDNVGSQLAITTEVFNPESDPTEVGYSIARIEFSNVSGIPTKRFTFLKDDAELSRSEDFVGSQLAIVTEVFNPIEEPAEEGYSLARTEVSDIDGIPTKRYTFLKDNVKLSESENLVGSQLSKVQEWFNPTDDPVIDLYVIANIQVSDFGGIPTKRFTFLKENVELSRNEDLVGSQLAITTEVFNPETDPEEDGYSVARTEVSDVDGIPTKRYTFLKDNVQLSRSEDKVGSQLAITAEVFNPEEDPEESGYSVARKEESEVDGIPTKRFTFLKDNAELSRSEDKVGSQLAIVTEIFKPETDPQEGGYSVARIEVSDVEGIPTKRFTFLKDDAELSRSEDKVGSQLAITTEVFKPTNDPEESGYSVARTEVSDVDGIPTKRFTLLKDDAELSRSEDLVGSQLAIVTEVFKPEADPEESGYSVARIEASDVDGIPTKKFTFLKDGVELSRSEDKVGSQLAITTEVFKPEADPTEDGYSVARIEVSDVDGIPTKRFTFLKDNTELSRNEDKVGSQLAIVTEIFNPTDNPEEPDYSVARTEVSDVEGIPTKRFTFLKEDVELFHTEDLEGGLNEIVEEWFKPIEREEKPEYVLIEKTQSDLGGIPTERYTFWKERGLIDESYVNESEGVIRTTQVFFSEVDDALVFGPVVARDTRNIDGIPTITVTTLQGAEGISLIGSGERLANSYDQLVSFTYPGILDIASQPTGGFTSYSWRLSAPVQSLVTATTYVIFQDTNTISNSDFTYGGATSLWNPTEWAKGQSYGVGYSYRPFAESKGFRGYRADADVVEVNETADNQFLINGNLLFEDTAGGLNVYGGPEDPNGKTYVLDVKITPAFVDIEGATSYKKVIIVANIPVQQNTEPTAPPTSPTPQPEPEPEEEVL